MGSTRGLLGAGIDLRSTPGSTQPENAARARQQEVVEFMTADTSLLPFARGLLPAIARGDLRLVETLVLASSAALRADANQRDARGAPALHCAVRTGDARLLAALLQQPGIKVNARDRYLRTALDVAREAEHDDLAFLLHGKGGISGDDIEEFGPASVGSQI